MNPSFTAHYFHLAAELFAGAWRVLAAAPDLMAKGTAMGMEFPRRVILGKGQDWRDVPYVTSVSTLSRSCRSMPADSHPIPLVGSTPGLWRPCSR